jgi:hypothetical protein
MSIATPLTESYDVSSNSITPKQDSISEDHPLPELVGRQSHGHEDGVDAITPEMRRREKFVFASMCLPLFLAGWNDATIGPLLPRIQHVYGVRLSIPSHLLVYLPSQGWICGRLSHLHLRVYSKYDLATHYIRLCILRASLAELWQTYI